MEDAGVLKREARNGSLLYLVDFPVAKFAKNSPVTGPNLNPLPVDKLNCLHICSTRTNT